MNPASFPWAGSVRLGIVHFMVHPACMGGEGPIARTADAILADGFFTVLEVGPVNDPAERRRLADAVRGRGASLAFACQPILLGGRFDLNAADEAARLKALDAVRGGLAQARELGAEALAVVSGPTPQAGDEARAADALVDSLATIGREAEGLPVHLETFDSDVDKRRFVGPTALAADVAGRARKAAPNVGLMLDLSHLPLQREPVPDALAAAGSLLTHAHAGNCVVKDPAHPRYGDTHPRFGIEGGENGVDELAAYLGGLFAAGYLREGRPRGVSIEVKPGEGETPEALLAHTKETWTRAWERVRPGT